MSVEIDVLICAYNEARNVPRVLESLGSQSIGAQRFRVIFVDNASTDETRRVAQENSQGLNLNYVYEARQGKNWACNAGYSHARTSYVAHIDADAKAESHWLENILRVIEQEQPDLFGGPIFPLYITPKPAWFLDAYNTDDRGGEPHYLPDNKYLNGANMVWRREVVERLGGFDVKVGLTGRGLARGDETDLMMRARKEIPNFKAFYHPDLKVYHLTRPETFSLWYWARRSFSQGRHDYSLWNTSLRKRPRYLRLAQFVGAATLIGAKGATALIRRDRASHPYWENYFYEQMRPEVYRLGMIWRLAQRNRAS